MQISHVKYFQNWIPIIAKWIYEEWSYAFPMRTLVDIQKGLFGRMNESEMPITLIAHDERGVLGTACLKATDMEILPDLTPWLASVFVHPDYRGQGVATALIMEVEKIARQQGFDKIHVFNPIAQGVFEKMGWTVLQTTLYGGKELAILVRPV